MIVVFTEQSLVSLQEILDFLAPKVSHEKLTEIRDTVLDATDILINDPLVGQEEPYLEHLGLHHRRLVVNHYKIIYRVTDTAVYITDIFDSRQDPDKMKG